ncbi:MAG: hypothetical protein OES13_03645 [Acidimicrobiia bacterium]|nr:hypothetical protein [Acidimicrobiia bacterium]
MLRESAAATSIPLDARAITDPSIDPLVPAGRSLLAFVDAALSGEDLSGTRANLAAELGWDGTVAAAAVIGNFEMMNRIADAIGMPVSPGGLARTEEWRALLGLDRFRH